MTSPACGLLEAATITQLRDELIDHRYATAAEPPCPLAPHHTHAERVSGEVRIRALFATEPEQEEHIRQRIDLALSTGRLHDPDGMTTRWRLCSSQRSDLAEQETDHAERLTRG
ncbi:MAG: hypothetical protein QOE54_4837 [Streptosporangiaceae bacterium]|jgi:hypothetical protein|nr:hypothetical protein [Streptosporangiaceae bacterium]